MEEIRAAGGVAHAIAADMSDAEEIEKLAGETISRVGTVDVLVNNAGGIGSPSPFEELSDEDWLGALELNLLSAVRLIRAVLPRVREQGWGRIINVASESGIQPDPFMPHYNASKAALINLTKSLSKAYASEGVLVNAVSPATI